MNNSYFSAIVIGNDRLSIMGAECLISEGNCQLHALISLCVYAEDWAKRNNIPWFKDFNSFIQSPVSSQPFDYLFNIAHFEYLPDFVLRMPKKLAINYHDALLPKYAGMHATSWALLNGETSHGITWHVITEKIDAGPILTQDQIPISEDDTALTLNLKCYQQAISSFKTLIVNLSSANIILKPQDLSLRTYFGRYKPFPFAGIISWETTSEEIDRVCRALDFGEYDNTLCSAKFVIHNCYYLLAKYELYSPSKDMPGTIVDFNRQFIQIATKSNDIRLLAIDDMYGCRISIPEFIDRHNITKGMLLHSLSIASIDKICLSIASIIKHEHFWVSELRKINSSPVLFIHQNTYSNSKKATQYESITLNIMDKLIYLCQPCATIVETKLAVILAYLYRLNNCDAFTVSFSHPSIKTACEDEDLLSPFVPFSIDFNSLDPFENILLTVKNTYNKIVKNKTFQKDIFARYKNIKKTELPISITIINEDEDCLFINSHINFSMNVTTYAMRVYFSPEYIKFSQQLISYLEIFMSSVCKKFFEEIRYQSLIPNNEKNKMLVEWNATTIDYPKNIGLHELFERQVKKTPNNLAIIFEDQEITYNELNQISNQLAHYIIKNKDKKNTNIIIYLERNLDAIISMLAILKSGNSYICIAPDAPLIQIQEIIMDCKTDVIITQEHLATHLKSHRVGVEAAIKIINLDAERVIISSEDKQNIISRVINQTAYILYTSGSTGKPKGVQIKHNSIVNLLLAMRHEVHFTAKDVLLALTPTTFDISGLEIYLPLISGAHFILATNPVRLDPTLIIKKIDQHNITIMQATPATWQMLVDVHWENKTKIKILCGGEGLSKRLSLKLGTTGAHFWNLYGPTETTIWSTIYSVKKHPTNITLELIGKPIANTKAYVLDKNLQLVPIGIVGTLWIAGDGVAIGYLNKPELTCKKFIADPFSNEPDCRMYNTGDQVKWLPDGNLEYIGRIDDQIKIRGLRIELGEINACLQEYPEIAQSIVISDGASPPNTKIIAYIILHNKASYNQDSLINYLKSRLYTHMIPSHFIIRDSFPLTFHGKIDKKALLLQEAVLDSDQKISPITREEGLLRDIWSDVLLIPAKNININDNFFRLGGHSLLANQVITRIHSLFFVKINVAAIFKAPTIKELAQLISHSVKSEQNYPLLLHVKENNAQYLSSNQLRLWFLSEFNHNSAIYNIFAGWHLQGDLNLHFLNNAIVDIIKQQGAFRTIFLSANGKPKQVLQPASAVNFNLEVEELYNTSFEQVQDYLKQLAAKPFKLDHEKPFRFKLLKLSENEYVLFICLHHIIADAWSFGILYRDLSLYYQSYFNQVIPVVKMLPAQYIDYCVWQHAIYNTTNDNYKKQINYWKDRLAYIQPLELPVDYVRPIIQTYAGDAVHFKIDPQNIQVLQKISDLNNITLFATVLSIFAIIMMKYSKQQDITIGIPIANRALEAVEHLIGFFVNTVVIRFDFANNPQFLDLLHITMNLILEAHDNSEVLFEKIIDTLHPERDQSRSPIFQVMFSFNNTISGNIEFPNVSVDQIKIASSYAHLDLICFLEEDGEGYIEYNTALFSRNTIQRIVDNYLTVLKNISTVSQQRVNEIFVLSNVERNLLKELGHNKKEFKIKKNLIELFEEQADKYSSKVAIIYGSTQITYFELNQRANQLAYLILNDFPKTNSYIAIYLDRNIDTIIAFLAVLKTGNAYVPIDCNAPRALTESIIIDANIALILTQKKYSQEVSQLELPFNIEFILVDELPNLNPNEKLSNLPSFLSTCEAYVLYTSGTTGKPKGVQITHLSLTNLMFSMKDEVDFSQKDVLLAISPLVFDLSVPDIYLPLTTGATLILANAATRFNPAEILQLITDFQVTIMQATPTTWQMMVAVDWSNDFNIKIICGGEGLNTQLAKELLNRGAIVWNFYGPTEATVWSTCCKINSVDDNHPLIPIGRPLANTEIYILDENLQPTPIGVLGELYIGGEGVALGYLNNPEMTSECFISHKIFNSKPRKLFKTGDLALWTHLHELHFLGRKDNQIKMRGHRIEPEAIEKVLQQYPDIYQAIVLDKNPMHEIELTAYIILKTSTIKLNEIRFFLIQHLPSYMIPSKFVVIHNIPLTFTGKVDRKNLPNIQDFYYLRNEPQVNVPLQNKYEKTISDTIKKLLILSNVDLEANFFDLGLHSLHLVEFSYTLNKALDKKIEIMDLFAYPTVRELANYLINSEDKMLQNLETHRATSRKSRRLSRRVTDND